MALKHNVSGTWKDATLWQNVGGTWKKITLWNMVSAVLKQITALLGASLPASMTSTKTYPASASCSIAAAGTYACGSFTGTWIQGGAGADYECRATLVSGDTPSGTLGTWLPLSSDRTWANSSDGSSTAVTNLSVEIRLAAAPNTVFTTSSVTLRSNGLA